MHFRLPPPSGFSRRPAQPVFMGRLAGGCRRLWQLARHSDYPLLTASPPSSVRLSWGGAGEQEEGQEPAEETYPIQSDPVLAVNLIIHATEPTDTWHPAAGRPGEL